MPVTTPVALTEPTAGTELLHTPPPTALLNVVADPIQTLATPVIVPGLIFTVTTAVFKQPVDNLYVIVEVPPATAETSPVLAPMLATLVLLLLQVPPVVPSDNVVKVPTHRLIVPPIAAGFGLTVTVLKV
jgi:hypothetical protein